MDGNVGGLIEAMNANVYGNGTQTLVLSHGFGCDQNVWHLLIPYFMCCFKLVVFDLAFAPTVRPGLYNPDRYSTYNAYAEDVVGVLDELNVSNAIFVGHSMSAMIGSLASIQKRDLFKQIIMLNGSPRYLNDSDYIGGYSESEVKRILGQMEQNYSAWTGDFAPAAVGQNGTAQAHEFEQSLLRMDPNVSVQVAQNVFLSDYRWVLEQVKLPCTIIQTENDIIVHPFVPGYMKKMLGEGAKVVMLDAHGHFPMLTADSLLSKVLIKEIN
ncbi:hypothetical protein Sjap_012955 [Stephania japonica]|uniref:AB hydrolase-1 domain-containing protein n=1 Tax=Stephania japonica TaxID=461633 RepID=A0AAP0NY55_9MAGN